MERFWTYSRVLLPNGAPVPGATVAVHPVGDPITLATIYDDNLLPPTPKTNPFTADADGYAFFYAPNGRYDVRFSGGTPPVVIDTPYTLGDILLADLGQGAAVGSSVIDLGGSRTNFAEISGTPATVDAVNWVLVPLTAWDQLPVGTTFLVTFACQVPTGASAVLQLFNPDTGQVIQDPTPFTDDSTMVVHTFTVDANTNALFGIFARLQAVVTGGDGLPGLLFMGQIQIVIP